MQLGIGAALAADGRKVVAMCGDGGFQLDLVEVWTAVQEKADVVFLVMNDNAYGVIGHIQDAMYEGRRYYDKIQVPELEKIAELAGMPYVLVDKAQDMGTAVAKMLKLSGPSLVEVDMNAIGEFPRYFKPPPYVEKDTRRRRLRRRRGEGCRSRCAISSMEPCWTVRCARSSWGRRRQPADRNPGRSCTAIAASPRRASPIRPCAAPGRRGHGRDPRRGIKGNGRQTRRLRGRQLPGHDPHGRGRRDGR